MEQAIISGVRGGKTNFQSLCVSWTTCVRKGEEYEDYKHIEMEIIKECSKFGLNPDEVFGNLHSVAMSDEELVVV